MLEETNKRAPAISSVCTSVRLCLSQKGIAGKADFIIHSQNNSYHYENSLSDTLESESPAFAYKSKTKALEILLLRKAATSFSLKKPQFVEL